MQGMSLGMIGSVYSLEALMAKEVEWQGLESLLHLTVA